MPRQPKGLSYQLSWVDARNPLLVQKKTYQSIVPAKKEPASDMIVGDRALHSHQLTQTRFDCTIHDGKIYKPDMDFVALCFTKLSRWAAAFARFQAGKVPPQRRANRFNPYAPLSFILHVSTDRNRDAFVTVYLTPLVNGKEPRP